VTPFTIGLFSATELYTYPVARLLGGADMGRRSILYVNVAGVAGH